MSASILSWLWRCGLAVFAAALALGLVHAVRTTGSAPGVATRDYGVEIDRALERGDVAGALAQMRLAATLRVDDPMGQEPMLKRMAETAHRAGDASSEIFALRQLLALRPADRGARLRLSTALIEKPGRTMADLKEAADCADIAVQIDPRSVTAWMNLARINDELGHAKQAQALRERALREQPPLDFRAPQSESYWEVP